MKKIFFFLSVVAGLVSCKDNSNAETFTSGNTDIMIEESVLPITEDMIKVFESHYNKASFDMQVMSESHIMNALFKDSGRLAVIPRELTQKEIDFLAQRAKPIITPIAKEAIVFIASIQSRDSVIRYDDFISELKNSSGDKIYVFDNVNSSLSNQIRKETGISSTGNDVFFLKSTKDVVEYVSKNSKAIGVIGSNWLAQPDEIVSEHKKNIKNLSVFNNETNTYVKPTQSTIADGSYPLTRTINIVDTKGNSGLGKGISSFAASDKGQRLVLKSGLMPITMPTREIIINQQ